jgi:hypothetical protein
MKFIQIDGSNLGKLTIDSINFCLFVLIRFAHFSISSAKKQFSTNQYRLKILKMTMIFAKEKCLARTNFAMTNIIKKTINKLLILAAYL